MHAASVAHGIPVIVVRDDADWTRFAALARTAVAGAAADSVSGVRLGDMFAFANAVATMTSGATSIVDPTGHVVGYSTIPGQPIDYLRRESTLTLQERTVPALDADYKVVYSLNTAVFVEPHDDEGGRLAIAVRAGGELLGSIWVIDPGDERREDGLDALNRLAPLAGLHMLHARSAADFTERRNADLVRTLMDDPGHASFAAAQLGLGPEYTPGFAVATFTIAHEFIHLLQARGLAPQGERSCDLWALARSPLIIDCPPSYLALPRALRARKTVDAPTASLLCRMAREAIERRERGDRRYLARFEREFAAEWAGRRVAATPVRRGPIERMRLALEG